MTNSQFLRSTTATLIALTLAACGSDGNGSADRSAGGSSPLVAVSSEPAGANCAAGGERTDRGQDTNGNGVLDANEITDTQYVCNDVPPVAYTIGGTVTGLNGSVVLENNADVFLTISASGDFTFDPPVIAGDVYAVAIDTQPPGQTCTVANGSGIATANVTNIQVTCTTHPLTLVSSSPAADATDVDRAVSPSMVFSAALDAATVVPANVTLTSAAGHQPITLSVSGTQLTTSPTRQLLPATTYTLQATTGVRGIHGEQLAAAASGSFTTRDGQWGSAVLGETNEVGYAQFPHMAVDANGNAMLVWQENNGARNNIWANRYTPDSGWGTPVLIENNDSGTATDPQVALDSEGNALAVWQHADGSGIYSIWANRYTPDIGWGSSILLETHDLQALRPKVAFDAAGNALAIWEQEDGGRFNVWSNRYVAGQGWSTAAPIETSDANISLSSPRLAVHASGHAVAVWVQDNDVWANQYRAGEGWGTPVLLEDDAEPAYSPDVAMDGDGNAMVVWQQGDGTRDDIWFNRATPDGQWDTATLVETEDASASGPRVAVNANGNAFAVWRQAQGANATIWSNRYTPEDGWGAAEPVQPDVPDYLKEPQIVVDAAGNALTIWHEGNEIYYNRYTNDRGWGTPALLDPLTYTAGVYTLVMGTTGSAIAAWSQPGSGREDIYVKRFE